MSGYVPAIVWRGDEPLTAGAEVRMERAPTASEIATLAEARVSSIAFPIQGARREVHEWHGGDFDAALAALSAARSCGLRTIVVTTLTRSNARVLAELPPLLKARGVTRWIVTMPRADTPTFTTIVPRIALGVPPMLHAIEKARALGIDARLEGFPHCVLGPFAERALASETRSYAPACEGCAARAACPGVDAAYLERFGDRELRTITRRSRDR